MIAGLLGSHADTADGRMQQPRKAKADPGVCGSHVGRQPCNASHPNGEPILTSTDIKPFKKIIYPPHSPVLPRIPRFEEIFYCLTSIHIFDEKVNAQHNVMIALKQREHWYGGKAPGSKLKSITLRAYATEFKIAKSVCQITVSSNSSPEHCCRGGSRTPYR